MFLVAFPVNTDGAQIPLPVSLGIWDTFPYNVSLSVSHIIDLNSSTL
jgi:hypothetical protein